MSKTKNQYQGKHRLQCNRREHFTGCILAWFRTPEQNGDTGRTRSLKLLRISLLPHCCRCRIFTSSAAYVEQAASQRSSTICLFTLKESESNCYLAFLAKTITCTSFQHVMLFSKWKWSNLKVWPPVSQAVWVWLLVFVVIPLKVFLNVVLLPVFSD